MFKASSLTLAAQPAQLRDEAAAYPNPTAGELQLPAGHTYREAKLYDTAGRLCRSLRLAPGSRQLELGQVPDGLYQLELRNAAGAAVTQRLAVQH
ncbi:T9SS type A sorting domain-containing protein [Hymenobacter jeollabukensis]|uniref:T9SS type A sorting domain-containing protein n=1 Tax=Hymenobacter jeollabukensis TaxID=2025313 RepID=A0A5R8WKW0_9BACT|nr:T9SS type A sorting domain-containing protein [Hymenobacter jeollabukensis]TLM89386.1 T9SS type A sorting domain-containing protein [Hymenobacter jeollabukensis]